MMASQYLPQMIVTYLTPILGSVFDKTVQYKYHISPDSRNKQYSWTNQGMLTLILKGEG